jgi:hypothetical protein
MGLTLSLHKISKNSQYIEKDVYIGKSGERPDKILNSISSLPKHPYPTQSPYIDPWLEELPLDCYGSTLTYVLGEDILQNLALTEIVEELGGLESNTKVVLWWW